MKLTLPIYVTRHEREHTVRPLFFPSPVERHPRLERALFLLARTLRDQLREEGKKDRHDALARWSFYPDLQFQRLDVTLELRRRPHRCRFLFVVFSALGRRLAFTPSVHAVWFELQRGENLHERAVEVLTHHFRIREKEDEDDFQSPETLALKGSGWITPLDVDIYPSQAFLEKIAPTRAALGPEDSTDGEMELHRVGRCLDSLYPDDLDRVVLRDSAVAELTRLLRAAERRPVLLLGPSLVGKTALLHEHVYRTVAARKYPHHHFNNTWLLSPQRLISGMSYVGQWEKRLLAILKVARLRNHVLFFDDFLGLYAAGRTSQSDLTVAHVLKPFIERREVRLVTEMTPEAFRVLREQDRGFADLFHVLPLAEPGENEVLQVLIAILRQVEGQQRCRFDLDVLPSVLDLMRRWVRHLAFPGKAAVFLRRLAARSPNAAIGREEVLRAFGQQTGLSLTFLDTRLKLSRAEVVQALEQQVIGQPAALAACADVIGIAKARLNDPERPLAAFLFLGPTGVGKTQCAKALADYLFAGARADQNEGPGPLLRFDMNEFIEPGSAARLAGTFLQPEGLLTSAVRRRPFAVVLFDEIEKTHTEVFDLLLQVLGEGRLTDALGRTVDFSNCLLILTSNLGVREAQSQLGLVRDQAGRAEVYLDAARRFFRPEFFNRLDRVVPFEVLARADVARIAWILLGDLLKREGLVRRKSILLVQEQALERVIDQGFDPQLGARALKRALERALAQPIAARLARGLPEDLTVIHVLAVQGELSVEVEGLQEAQPSAALAQREALADQPDLLPRCRAALRRLAAEFNPLRPQGEITAASLKGEHYRYFQIKGRLDQLRGLLDGWQTRFDEEHQGRKLPSLPADTRVQKKSSKKYYEYHGGFLRELAAASDIADYLNDLFSSTTPQRAETPDGDPLDHLAVAHLLAESFRDNLPEMVLVLVRQLTPSATDWKGVLARQLELTFVTPLLNLDSVPVDPEPSGAALPGLAIVFRGPGAWPLLQWEVGTHLVCPVHEGLVPVQVLAWPLPEGSDPLACLRDRQRERESWQQQLLQGTARMADDPWRLQQVLRIAREDGKTFDLRTGLAWEPRTDGAPPWIRALPLPPELFGTSLE